MKTLLFSIHDIKSKIYNKPFHQLNQEEALRTASDLANDKEHTPGKHPADFSMFQLGSYEDTTGKCDLYQSPEHICNLNDLVLISESDLDEYGDLRAKMQKQAG